MATIPAITDPELKGKPKLFTKNTSEALKNLSVVGSNSLKITSKMATTATLAMIKFFIVMSLWFLKKYIKPIAGIVINPIK